MLRKLSYCQARVPRPHLTRTHFNIVLRPRRRPLRVASYTAGVSRNAGLHCACERFQSTSQEAGYGEVSLTGSLVLIEAVQPLALVRDLANGLDEAVPCEDQGRGYCGVREFCGVSVAT